MNSNSQGVPLSLPQTPTPVPSPCRNVYVTESPTTEMLQPPLNSTGVSVLVLTEGHSKSKFELPSPGAVAVMLSPPMGDPLMFE